MLFFRKRPLATGVDDQTQPLRLIRAALAQTVRCKTCQTSIATADEPALELVPCPKCGRPVFVPMLLAGYWLYKFIGRGGMGIVYKAVSEGAPNHQLAVKLLPRGHKDNEHFISCMSAEADMLRVFSGHPNIVSVVEFGMADDEYFLVTDYIDGHRLDYVVVRYGPFEEERALQLALDLIKVEIFICRNGYLYRDLKPENIMIRADGAPVLVDFGLCQSRNATTRHSTADEVDGAPHYMPPERATGAREREHSEIYSLGMVLYYVVSGKTFFASGSAQEVMERHVYEARDRDLLASAAAISPRFQEIIWRMIQRNSADRYQSFARLEEDLRECRKAVRD